MPFFGFLSGNDDPNATNNLRIEIGVVAGSAIRSRPNTTRYGMFHFKWVGLCQLAAGGIFIIFTGIFTGVFSALFPGPSLHEDTYDFHTTLLLAHSQVAFWWSVVSACIGIFEEWTQYLAECLMRCLLKSRSQYTYQDLSFDLHYVYLFILTLGVILGIGMAGSDFSLALTAPPPLDRSWETSRALVVATHMLAFTGIQGGAAAYLIKHVIRPGFRVFVVTVARELQEMNVYYGSPDDHDPSACIVADKFSSENHVTPLGSEIILDSSASFSILNVSYL
ncbi:hypothetical protein BV898_04221 [Hypsibius exemplaris]|uniref:Uncharacterized protein n=1 Tax=Hypsibius exemplaris TaxID=2072580 RepID=A0A1W0X3L0_HYPEX|nr:hypothetical protein BV898_04221 [Hypsibius exemplaris]